jgi:hypothetical protein
MTTGQEIITPMNCQVCGSEYFESELNTVKLAGFKSSIVACSKCLDKTAEDSFKDAADILNDIVKIAASAKDPEKRLKAIRSLLGE